MTFSLRCVLVGSESLLVQCGEALGERGHRVAAVVTDRPEVAAWAAGQGVLVLADTEALAEAGLEPFDYLFSITNLKVLPDNLLALPRSAAINFHDGPLPEYAGLNTPVWALLNGETVHGVSWHLMTRAVDEGAILVQRRFPVAADESALTLNTRCFEAAIESFDMLLDGLERGTLLPVPQAGPPQRCYRRSDRPEAACAIRWERSAGQIARLVRALDHGDYANPVGVAKASVDGRPVIVRAAHVAEGASGLLPGTVVAVDARGIVVATGEGDLLLTRLATLSGEALSPAEATARLGLAAGQRFDLLDRGQAAQLGALDAAVAAHEGWWRRRLETVQPVVLPFIDRSALPSTAVLHHADLVHPGADEPVRAERVVAAMVGYLARLTDRDALDVGYADPVLAAQFDGFADWFSRQVPLRATVSFDQGFDVLCTAVGAELREMRRRIGFAADLVARTPALRANPAVMQVAVVRADRLEEGVALPGAELTVVVDGQGGASRWIYDSARIALADVATMQRGFLAFLEAAERSPGAPLGELPVMDAATREAHLLRWNDNAAPVREACVHQLIAEQAARTPERIALTCGGASLSYREVDRRANRLARHLAALGVGPDVLVGLHLRRSLDMVVALLAIQKAGGAYVPLDPDYPKDRIAYMVEDARLAVVVTEQALAAEMSRHGASVVCIDADALQIAAQSAEPFDGGAEPHNLAYVIYTSGSTGRPKGVMVEHRNVANFFAGMDARIGEDGAGTWLAVTSLSFDISVLELCWTLARGFHVVLYTGEDRAAPPRPHAGRALDFSLFYFASDESKGGDKYRLLMEGAKFADSNGFAAVWTPERHFHAFGGLYPNPAVTSAAVAAVTERVAIRAGSVVLPLHHPIRVAEEWALVDNLSRGRVGISFAAGWQPDDFVLRPENYAGNKEAMLRDIDVVRRLWRGEALAFPGPLGTPVELSVLPRPVQAELPFWLTSAGNTDTFVAAGRMGANILTHLLGQSIEELEGKLAAYRRAWTDAGHAGEGHVTLMLHSFVGPDAAAVREQVRRPLIEYLRSSASLIKQYAWSFPAFKRRPGMEASEVDLGSLDDGEMDALLEYSFERYYETSGLFGTPESCLAIVDRIKGVGVDELACLIDFGIASDLVLDHLPYLDELRRRAAPAPIVEDGSIPALMQRHGVTHFQCTPSMARMLLMDPRAAAGLGGLRRMMVGGEAFPPLLARELTQLVGGQVMNMYGPTETTIWSSVHAVDGMEGQVPLGQPLVNQQIYIADRRLQPVPPGVPGELLIGGKGVVRGYRDRPELTAERFVAHPLVEGARAYRTGDLARLTADGRLEFLGRLDHQVKVRGHRIELGEIEAALSAHPAVGECVVVAREDVPGDVRLVAYFTASPAPPVAELRERLRGRLPEFMLPSHFLPLAAIPKTPNGKIDRKALPAPDAAPAAEPAEAYVAPAGELEEKIAAIWRDALKLPRVGMRDNFFDLGGHSLLAVQVHRRLKSEIAETLSITDIFRFPTVQSLGAHLRQDGGDGGAVQKAQDRGQERLAALQRRQGLRVALATGGRGLR